MSGFDYIHQYIGTYNAAQDLSEKQSYAVALNGLNAEPMWQLPGESLPALGILDNKPRVNETARVVIFGIASGIIDDSESSDITINTRLKALPNGKLVVGNGAFTAMSNGTGGDSIAVFVGAPPFAYSSGSKEAGAIEVDDDYETTGDCWLDVTADCTITLRANPANGEEVKITSSTDGLIAIDGNGKTILGESDALIDVRHTTLWLKYSSVSGEWKLI